MKKVLIAGPCTADANDLEKELSARYSLEFKKTLRIDKTKELLDKSKFDLVLVNRVFAGDSKEGFEILKYQKEKGLKSPSIMLSRFPEKQEKALSMGAVASFDIDLIIGFITPARKTKHEEAYKILDKYLKQS